MKPRIAIADDDPDVQDIFRIIFHKEKYKTTIFSNGDKLLNNNEDLPDIFLLDKQMPGTDGLDVCRVLKSKSRTKNIPVIIISGAPDIMQLAEQAGADDVIQKPFSPFVLLEKVKKVLQNNLLNRR